MLARTISKLTTKLTLLIGTSLALVAGGVVTFVARTTNLPARTQQPTRLKLQTNHRTIKFNDAVSLATPELEASSARPLTLAAADFDEDGVPDLLGGFVTDSAGQVRLYRGNVEAILPTQKTAPNPSAFFPASSQAPLPAAPDFLVTGDFNNDGHFDFIAAARHRNALYLLAGDGKGNFAAPQTLELNGDVTALDAGEINRRDGLSDLAVAIQTPHGAEALIYAAAEGAWAAQPQTFELAHPATSFAFGTLTGDAFMDVAIAAGSELVILQGGVTTPTMTRTAMPFALEAVAIGRFTGDANATQVAMLARGGSIYVTQDHQASQPSRLSRAARTRWQPELMLVTNVQAEAARSTQLLRANVSASAKDDLLLLAANKINFVTNNSAPELVGATLENQPDVVAALPLRVSASALNGLVFLSSNHAAPLVAVPEVAMTFTVNSTADDPDVTPGNGICANSNGVCTLRAAIQEANANVGQDTIRFNIGAGAQQIGVPIGLTPITESIIIDGTPPAGAPADQTITLRLTATAGCRDNSPLLWLQSSGSRVRGLTIADYPCGSALAITGANNLVDGNNLLRNVYGVDISEASNNTIGGTTAGSRNVISSNTRGIYLHASTLPATQNTIIGNYIGTDATGTRALGNLDGVWVEAGNNTIGGTTVGARNVISGNQDGGISFFHLGNPLKARNNTIIGNYIGVDVSGLTPLGNGYGVFVDGDGMTIGGAAAGAANVIANNSSSYGIAVLGRTPVTGFNNAILTNSIYNNAGLGIDLGLNGVTANDPGDGDTGANGLQNFPLLTSALSRVTNTTVTGTLNSTASSTFTIELFHNAACDASGNGEGETFLARTTVTTNAAGQASFSIVTAAVPVGRFITATATDANGNTSEFSACRAVQNAVADLAVTQTATPNPVTVGNNLAYNVTVTNTGPDDATLVLLSNAISIPNGQFTLVSVTPSQGTCTGIGNCNLGTIASTANATVRIVITPTIPTAGTPPNSVTATNIAAVTSVEQDPVTTNNSNATSATVNASADLAITQTAAPNSVPSGGVVTYTITITNNGPSTASNISARFDPSPLLANMTCTAPAGSSCGRDGNPFFAFTPILAPGTAVFTLRGTLPCLGQTITFTNGVTVSSSTFDANLGNNSSSVSLTGQAGTAIGTIAYDAGGTALSLGPVAAGSTATPPSGTFTLTNTGCLPMNLTTALFTRAGNTANLTGLDDSRYFSLRLVPTTGAEIPLNPTANPDRNAPQPISINRTLPSGQSLRFRILFNPPLPFFAGFFASRDQLLFANQVLPDSFASSLVFNFVTGSAAPSLEAAGDPGTVAAIITGRVSPAIQIIPRDGNSIGNATTPLVIMETLRGDFRVRVSLYDANKNPTRITYQFFDTFRQPASNPIAVDLTTLLSSSPILPGQCFTLQQDFSGAAGRPDIVYVRVSVNDGDGTTVVATSSPFLPALTATTAGRAFATITTNADVVTLPPLGLDGSAGTRRRQTDSRSTTSGQ